MTVKWYFCDNRILLPINWIKLTGGASAASSDKTYKEFPKTVLSCTPPRTQTSLNSVRHSWFFPLSRCINRSMAIWTCFQCSSKRHSRLTSGVTFVCSAKPWNILPLCIVVALIVSISKENLDISKGSITPEFVYSFHRRIRLKLDSKWSLYLCYMLIDSSILFGQYLP